MDRNIEEIENITVLIDGVEHKLNKKLSKDIKVITPKETSTRNTIFIPTFKKSKQS